MDLDARQTIIVATFILFPGNYLTKKFAFLNGIQ